MQLCKIVFVDEAANLFSGIFDIFLVFEINLIIFIVNSLYVRNNNVSPASGGGYIIVLIIYESAINVRNQRSIIMLSTQRLLPSILIFTRLLSTDLM
jgi:hypothetical protein